MPEAVWLESRHSGEFLGLRIVARLGFGRREVSDRLEQPPVVEPVDPFEGCELDRLKAAPRPAAVDELLEGYEKPENLLGDQGLLKGLQKALMERALGAELTVHLGYAKGDPGGRGSGNNRNGHGRKRVLAESGAVDVSVPRDRNASFEPQLVWKGQSRLPGFDEKVISLYAWGMTQRGIRGHLEELYAISVSPDLISRVTDAVIEEVKAWQSWPLDPIYPVIFFDALRVKIRDEGAVRNKAVYLAIGIRLDGTKEILGLWIEQSEGAKFCYRRGATFLPRTQETYLNY